MLPESINTLEELQKEQERLIANMEITLRELSRSAAQTTDMSKNFVLKNILLPVGAITLGAVAARVILGASDHAKAKAAVAQEEEEEEEEEEVTEHHSRHSGSHWFPRLMLVALPFVQHYLMKEKIKEEVKEAAAEEEAGEDRYAASMQEQPLSDNWLTTLISLTIPILQHYFISKASGNGNGEVVVERQRSDNGETYQTVRVSNTNSFAAFDWLFKLLPVALPLIQQYFLSHKADGNRADVKG